MTKITAGDPASTSLDVVARNIGLIRALFPELVTEGSCGAAIDIDILKQLVGDRSVTDADEKFGLMWHGKRGARHMALSPSLGTLRPCPGDSVEWDSTRNLMIEGDNLETMKLLHRAYAGKVKMIYIDPPYNTGKDFLYPDNFRDGIRNYLEVTGQSGGGRTLAANAESGGRFHTDWLTMMYPRIKLAHGLLRDDGALFISIDDREVDNLKRITAEIFGEENCVGLISVIVNPRGRHLDQRLAKSHEYVAVFVKDAFVADSIIGLVKEGTMLEEYDKQDKRGRYRELGLRNRNQSFNPITRPNLYYPLYVDPRSGRVSTAKKGGHSEAVLPVTGDGVETCWTWGRDKVEADNETLTARQADDGTWRIYRKDYLLNDDGETAVTVAKSVWMNKEFNHDYGRRAVKELLGGPVMDFPKSPYLIQRIVAMGAGPSDIVLDFFAGSGTTAHAVWMQNAADGGSRRCILVQLPEPLDPDNKDQRLAADFCKGIGRPMNIAEITKERLRRAATAIREAHPQFPGDLGFRVFKLDTTNISGWDPATEDAEPPIQASSGHLKAGRSDLDILYELLLKATDVDLCAPVETKRIAGTDVFSLGSGVLMACLAPTIERSEAEALAKGIVAWHEAQAPAGDSSCVFRDSAFADDAAKADVAAILQQHGIANVRSL